MATRKLNPTGITTEAQLDKYILKISKDNPKCYITYLVLFGDVEIFIHDKKPQSLNSGGVENCIRRRGGFFRNGKIVKASETLMARYNYCPILK